jgi:hypothetical protein
MTLNVSPDEGSTFIISVDFQDSDGSAVIPNSATWSMLDVNGEAVNGRLDVPITPLASSYDIVLTCDDLLIGAQGATRIIFIKADYDSSAGSGLCLKGEVSFTINNLVGV